MIYLYLKVHNETGLKYLGKTTQDPYKYKGSGKYWKRHIKIHGTNISTRILRKSNNSEHIKQWGLIYSHLFNIIEDNKFANLKLEEGDGGCLSHTTETKIKISNTLKGKIPWNLGKHLSEETKHKLKNKIPWNKGKIGIYSKETREKMSAASKGRLPWNKGIPHTNESNEKNRLAHLGKKHSEETKNKHRLYKPSEEQKRKISKSVKLARQNNNWSTKKKLEV